MATYTLAHEGTRELTQKKKERQPHLLAVLFYLESTESATQVPETLPIGA